MKPARAARAAAATVIALVAVAYQLRLSTVQGDFGTDFDPIRLGARLLLHGQSPYQIGPSGRYVWPFPLLYPLPAVLLGVPFVALPLVAARCAFVGISAFTLAYVSTARAWWPLVATASASWWYAIGVAQWSPLLLAAWYVPAIGLVLAAKPNVGASVLAGRPTRAAFVGCLAVAALSFTVRPTWFGEWLGAIRGQPHIQPMIATWLGLPLLLAVLRWRQPEARLLLALSIVPINPAFYDGLLLFAIPQTVREALALATLSWFVEPVTAHFAGSADYVTRTHVAAIAMTALMFLPCLAMLFRPHAAVSEPTVTSVDEDFVLL